MHSKLAHNPVTPCYLDAINIGISYSKKDSASTKTPLGDMQISVGHGTKFTDNFCDGRDKIFQDKKSVNSTDSTVS
ncbi:hypothetical protein JTE90_014692 [Oedothorax gibbosus]|uniref:Uncharacterized protein n=1 Tax=Oedothorax gibbosus TaxID=931172 RepID=A0AAV6TTR0_9ARAC|nr:hypothetical protein JTE90_014692 [Oedothorax gibbosus]